MIARIKTMAGLVTASADPQLSDEWGNPTRVKITLKDGEDVSRSSAIIRSARRRCL